MSVQYEDGVFEELLNCSAYLADQDEEIANRFLDACDDSFRMLANNPKIGTPGKFESEKFREVRMWRVKGFEKYLIFYVPVTDGIKLLHLLHSAVDYKRVFEDEF